jgi:mevalonate pyrophosphate decarboxylase
MSKNAYVLELSADESVLDNLKENKTKKITSFLIKGGEFLSKGIKKISGSICKSLEKGGNLMISKMKKSEQQKKVKPETLAKIQMAKTVSGSVVTFTREEVFFV